MSGLYFLAGYVGLNLIVIFALFPPKIIARDPIDYWDHTHPGHGTFRKRTRLYLVSF
jgi:hypothetical protein